MFTPAYALRNAAIRWLSLVATGYNRMNSGFVSPLPSAGSVAGIDVGWSRHNNTTAVCRLSWTESKMDCCFQRCTAKDSDRKETIDSVLGTRQLLAVAIDGPLRPCFAEVKNYRTAERLLSRGDLYKRIRGAASSRSPMGKNLNVEANRWVRSLKEHACVREVGQSNPIRLDTGAFFETFPNSFLGVMIKRPDEVAMRGKRSDRYFRHLAHDRGFDSFLQLIGGHSQWIRQPTQIRNHEDRAAFVCALSALCIAAGSYVAVGDTEDGWIALPPQKMFADWAWNALQNNVSRNGGVGCVVPNR